MTAIGLIVLSIAAIIFGVVRIVSLFKSSEDEVVGAEKQIINEQQEVIKEIAEEKHENATPQQLVDFFNRPHP